MPSGLTAAPPDDEDEDENDGLLNLFTATQSLDGSPTLKTNPLPLTLTLTCEQEDTAYDWPLDVAPSPLELIQRRSEPNSTSINA